VSKDARDLVPLSPRPGLPFEERIALLEQEFSGRLGFHAVRLDNADEVGLRAADAFPTASVIKVGLCCAVLDLVRRGEAGLDEKLQFPPPGRRVAGGGILKQLEVDELSLRDAIELAITLSDNVATNALLERCDADRVNAYLAGVGLAHTRILGPIDFTRVTHDVHGGIGVSTPRCSPRSRAPRSSTPRSARTSERSSSGSTTRTRYPAGSTGIRMPSTTAETRF
jgi:beta-lactamase class A